MPTLGLSTPSTQPQVAQADPFAAPTIATTTVPAPQPTQPGFAQDPFAASSAGPSQTAPTFPPPQQPDLFAASASATAFKAQTAAPPQATQDPFALMSGAHAQPVPPPVAIDSFDAFTSTSPREPQPADPFAFCDGLSAQAPQATNGDNGPSIWNEGLTKGILDLSLKSPDRSSGMIGAPMRQR